MNQDIKVLKKLSEYELQGDSISFQYDSFNLSDLKDYININFNNKSEIEMICGLLKFTFDNLIAGNQDYYKYQSNCNAITILEDTKRNKIRSNCYMYSTVLTELLLSYNFKARLIVCRPYNFYQNTDCHCMVHVFVESQNKWILVDPANCAMYRNINGEYISIAELRQYIISEREYNIFGVSREYSQNIKKFLPQYMAVFFCFQNNGYNTYSNNSKNCINVLLPKCFKVKIKIDGVNISYCEKSFWK